MKVNKLNVLIAVTLLSAGCTKEVQFTVPVPTKWQGNGVAETVFPEVVFDDDVTKIGMDANESTGLSFTWTEGDAMGVYSPAGGFARYGLKSGEGTANGLFDGDGFALKEGYTYNSFFPYQLSFGDRTAIPLSYGGQDGTVPALLSHAYLYANAVAGSDGSARFVLNHAGAFLRLRLSLPSGTPVDRVEIIPMYGEVPLNATLNLETGETTPGETSVTMALDAGAAVPDDGTLTLWAAMPPGMNASSDYAVLVHSGDTLFTSRRAPSRFIPGKAYRWDIAPSGIGAAGAWGYSSVTEKVAFGPSTDAVPSGEYSGITWLGGTSYAVVHDKLNGGGIVLYDIAMDDSGTVTAVTMTTPSGTAASSVTGRDNEGVAYFPSSNTVFVSSESDQQIREYTLDGTETGRGLAVPSDLLTDRITSNKGFEALTYDAATRRFWTVTEGALTKDTFVPRILRLQAFGDDLAPAERFLYRTDEPSKSADEAAAAASYVFGVPALAALPDGRVLVMEREVYVPNGGTFAKLLQSFTNTKIYAVNPGEDNAGILRKSLVYEFRTGAIGLANYEGMCAGPELPDGSRVLVLVPDSQGGQGGLTKEYVKTIVIKK